MGVGTVAAEFITPDEIPTWVPGELTVSSKPASWDKIDVRGYRYAASDVEIPSLRDFVVVAYRDGVTDMRRRAGRNWIAETVGPGDVSIMTNAIPSHWIWTENVEVVHVYLSPDEVAETCRQMYDREVEETHLRDVLRADDPAIHRAAMALANETVHGGPGSQLLIDSISCQLSVHILRRYADVLFRESSGTEGLTFRQERAVREYIREHLDQKITLDDLAGSVGLSRFHFGRRFRESIGFSPYDFVIRERVELAKTMLSRTDTDVLEVVNKCGFADQSHLTRVFKKRVGLTPGQFRAAQ